MVRQPIKDLDVKKVKMAKQVLAVFEILGIKEADLDNLVNLPNELNALREENKALKGRITELEEFKKTVERTAKNEAKGGTSVGEEVKKAFIGKVEEFNPYGR